MYSRELSGLVLRMMDKDPSRRPTISAILNQPIFVSALHVNLRETIQRNQELKTSTIRRVQGGELRLRQVDSQAKLTEQELGLFGVDPEPVAVEAIMRAVEARPEERKEVQDQVKQLRKIAYADPAPVAAEGEEEEIEKDYKENVQRILETEKALIEEPREIAVKPAKRLDVVAEEYEDIPEEAKVQNIPIRTPEKIYSPEEKIRGNLTRLLGQEKFSQVYAIVKQLRENPRFRNMGTSAYQQFLVGIIPVNRQIVVLPQFTVLLGLEERAAHSHS